MQDKDLATTISPLYGAHDGSARTDGVHKYNTEWMDSSYVQLERKVL